MSLEQFKTQILLLHSQQSTLDVLGAGFSDRYTVHTATSGIEALDRSLKNSPQEERFQPAKSPPCIPQSSAVLDLRTKRDAAYTLTVHPVTDSESCRAAPTIPNRAEAILFGRKACARN